MFIKSIIGKSKWINTKEFVLTSKSEEINFKASVDKEKLDLFFTPNNNTEDQLVDALLILSTATNKAQIEYLIKDRIKEFTTKWH